MRNVLRPKKYASSFGGIYVGPGEQYTELPAISGSGMQEWQAFVDGFALVTPACSALSDPCAGNPNVRIPETFVSRIDHSEPVSRNVGTDADAIDIPNQIADYCEPFCVRYIDNISRIFLISGGETQAVACLKRMFAMGRNKVERHSHTGIGLNRFTYSLIVGYGILCGTMEGDIAIKPFEGISILSTDSAETIVKVRFSSAKSILNYLL